MLGGTYGGKLSVKAVWIVRVARVVGFGCEALSCDSTGLGWFAIDMIGVWICRGVAIQLLDRTPSKVQIFGWCNLNMQVYRHSITFVNGSLYGVRCHKHSPESPLTLAVLASRFVPKAGLP